MNTLKASSNRTRWLARFVTGLWTGLLGLALPALAAAADDTPPPGEAELARLSLEDLLEVKVSTVSGASRYDQKLENVPASVTILTSADIHDYGYRTLAEALNSARGIYLNYDRNYTLLGVRGFQLPGDSNSRVLLLIDGQRINENIYDGAIVGTDCILDVDLIDRIEIVRGPGSSIYGSNALFGVINVVTRGAEARNGIESSVETGSFAERKARFGLRRKTGGGTEFRVSGSIMRNDGPRRLFYPEFDNPATNGGFAIGLDDDRSVNLLTTLLRGGFSAEGAVSSRDKGVPTASYGTVFDDARFRTIDTQAFLNLRYRGTLAGATEVMARTSYSYYRYRGTFPYAGADSSEVILNHDDALGDWVELEAQATRRLAGGHTLTAGIEHRRNLRKNVQNYNENPRDVLTDVSHHSHNSGAYAQGELKLGGALALTTGLRYDRYAGFGGTVNPRLGLVFNPGSRTDVKLLYGRAFRAPNVFEAAVFDPASKPNPLLSPENIRSYELVFEQTLREGFRFTAVGFLNRMQEVITQVVDPVDSLIVSRNTDRVEARGLEFELGGRLPGGLRGRISYTLQRADNRATGEELANSPRHLAKLNMRVPLRAEKLGAGFEIQYSSSVETLAGRRAGAFWLANLTLAGRDLIHGLDASAGLYNLFDRNYGHPGGGQHVQDIIRQDGRTWRVKVTGRL